MRLRMGIRVGWRLLAGILLLALPSVAQVEVLGTTMGLSGDIGTSYNGSVNQGDSSHSLGLNGDASLTGSYYNPNFLNFAVRPYYNRAQSNSLFGAITNTSGVNSTLNLFGGSHFPGTISYGKVVNSSGEYGFGGAGIGLATNGNNQGFAVGWSALVPGLPTLSASYSINSGSSSIYGTEQESSQTDHDLTLTSTYMLAGFRLAGGFSHRTIDGTLSELVEGVQEPVESNSATNNYQVSATHSFPMSGAFSLSYSRTGYDYSFHDGNNSSNSGGSDTVNGSLNFRPVNKLSVGVSGNYTDSLLGSLPEPVVAGGGGGTVTDLGTFRSFMVGTDANYQPINSLSLRATVSHVQQDFLGQSYGATQFGGSANYNMQHNLLTGLSFSVGVVDTATKEGNDGLGFVGSLNYNRKFLGWDMDANFSYSQDVATLVVVYTSSSYSYVTNARRRVGNRSYFMAGYSGSHSGFTATPGSSSSAQRVSSSFTYNRYSLNGFYSKSTGTAAFTGNGLVQVPGNLPPEALPPGSVILFNSKAYGANASGSPIKRLNLSLGYAQATGDTIDPLATTFTKTELLNGVMQYRLRKIYLNGGYTHLRQSVGTPGTAPISVTTYYIGFSRWFNFF